MAIITAKYRAFISDNYQGASGKPYEDKVQFVVDNLCDVGGLFNKVESEILKKTMSTSQLTQCRDDANYQLISIEVTEGE